MLVFCVLRTTIWHCTGKGLHMGMLIALLPALFLGSNSVMTASQVRGRWAPPSAHSSSRC